MGATIIEQFDQALAQQEQAAAARCAAPETGLERERVVAAIDRRAGLEEFNAPDRMARRLDRLTRYAAGEPVPMSASEMPTRPAEEVIAASIERAATRADPTVGPLA